MSNVSSTKKGFSLLELMMVITILAVMMGVLVPNMGSMMEATALQRSSRLIADLLRYARSSAIQSSSTAKVIFSQTPENSASAVSSRRSTAASSRQNQVLAQQEPVEYQIEEFPLQQPGVFSTKKPPIEIPDELGDSVTIENIILQSMGGAQQQGFQQQTGTQAQMQQQMNLQSNSANEMRREIVFYPDGSTSDTFIYLTNGRQTHTIGIVGLTGQILRWDERVESFYVQ